MVVRKGRRAGRGLHRERRFQVHFYISVGVGWKVERLKC